MKKTLSLLLCLLLCLGLLAGCGGKTAQPVLPRPDGLVLDRAGVLSAGTVARIQEGNHTLSAAGAAIAVVTVDVSGGKDIAAYAQRIFSDWSLSADSLLVLLSIGEEDYYTLQGKAIQKDLPSSALKQYAWAYLESDFAYGDYDAGVAKLFEAYYAWYDGRLDLPEPDSPSQGPDGPAQSPDAALEDPAPQKGGSPLVLLMVLVAALLLAGLVLLRLAAAQSGRRRRRGRRRSGGSARRR